MIQAPQLTVVGLGPGDPELITVAGARALREADVIFAPRRRGEQSSLALSICRTYIDAGRQQVETLPLVMEQDSAEAGEAWEAAASTMADALRPGVQAVYVLLGDPMIYGSFAPLKALLLEREPSLSIRFLPGVTSFCAAAAASGEPLVSGDQRLAILPGIYENDQARIERTLEDFDSVAVLKAGPGLPRLLRSLEPHREQLRIQLAERVGMPEERLLAGYDELQSAQAGYFSLALLKRDARSPAQKGQQKRAGTVAFVGAGPGAPDLLTLRAKEAIEQADAILYADSLVMETITGWAGPDARSVPTSGMHLEEIVALMQEITSRGGRVARVHSGDPSLYGALQEQIQALEEAGIDYEIIPGVTVAFAAAARLRSELTIPELTQTIILTRISGRASAVPESEALRGLAAHRASLAIYLAATRARQVQQELLDGGYSADTPVAICYRLEWPDEQIVRCRLDQLAEQMRAHGFTRQTLILISPALATLPAARSRLYDKDYTHRFRNRRTRQAQPAPVAQPRPQPGERRRPLPPPTIVAITRSGSALALKLAAQLKGAAYVPERFATSDTELARPYQGSAINLVRELWQARQAFVLVMATGIAVRAIGPLAQDKRTDPAVVVCDDAGCSAISLLGGHLGGANQLARSVATCTGGQAIVTTASDLQGLPSLDLLADEYGWRTAPGSALTRAMAALANGEQVGLFDPHELLAGHALPDNIVHCRTSTALEDSRISATVVISDSAPRQDWLERGVVFHPPVVYAGIGCRRGTAPEAIETALHAACAQAGVAPAALAGLATVQLKADEPGLLACAEQGGLPLHIYGEDEIRASADSAELSPSAARAHLDLPGVAEPCALLAAGTQRLLLQKQVGAGVTVALARKEQLNGEG